MLDELVNSRTIPGVVFPELLARHKIQLKENNDDVFLYSRQVHEIYVYTFFKNSELSAVSEIVVENSTNSRKMDGNVLGLINMGNINVYEKVNADIFYNKLLNAPLPFVFIPNGSVDEASKFIKGVAEFKNEGLEGLMMDLVSASNLGLGFICADLLKRNGVVVSYIGIVYPKQN